MLTCIFPQLNQNKAVSLLKRFFGSWYYIAFIALVTACAGLFGGEIFVYYVYALVAVAMALFADDTLPAVPIVCCAYFSVAAKNNPSQQYNPYRFESASLNQPYFLVNVIIVISIIFLAVAARLVYDFGFRKDKGGRGKGKPALLWGFVALGAGYMLAGVGGEKYGWNSVFFGFIQIVSISICYFLFYYTVDWDNVEEGYIFKVMIAMGVVLVLETIAMYFNPGVFKEDGSIDRYMLSPGWGTYNNIGNALAMSMPAPFYFAIKKKRGWLYSLLAGVFFIAVVFTQSRAAMIFAAVVLITGEVFVIIKTKGRERIGQFILVGAAIAAVGILALIARDKLASVFSSIVNIGFSDGNGRERLYREAIQHFTQSVRSVFLGVGFFASTANSNSAGLEYTIAPPMYHNTILQMLASGGIILLGIYLYHRWQTAKLLLYKTTAAHKIIALCILSLLLISLLDCHFFRIGPGLVYSVLLVVAEGLTMKNKRKAEAKNKDEENSSQPPEKT